jgi:ferredoxin
MDGKKAFVKDYDEDTVNKEKLNEAVKVCPVKAIESDL